MRCQQRHRSGATGIGVKAVVGVEAMRTVNGDSRGDNDGAGDDEDRGSDGGAWRRRRGALAVVMGMSMAATWASVMTAAVTVVVAMVVIGLAELPVEGTSRGSAPSSPAPHAGYAPAGGRTQWGLLDSFFFFFFNLQCAQPSG